MKLNPVKVALVFNLTDIEQDFQFSVPRELLGVNSEMTVEGAEAKWTMNEVEFDLSIQAMSPGLICIGDSTQK